MRWVVLGVAGSKRTRGLREACERLGRPAPVLVAWRDWLRDPACLAAALSAPCVFKVEPPGDDAEVHHALVVRGAERLGRPVPPPAEPGELAGTDLWFAGFSDAMDRLAATLAQAPGARPVNPPADILAMTDKLECQQRLQAAGVPVPRLLGPVADHAAFVARLDAAGLDRGWLKARFGSSAAGVVAFRRNRRGQVSATTSAHLVDGGGGAPRLFNVKRVRSYHRPDDVRRVMDLVAAQGAYAEAWVPKPRAGAGHFDLRLLTLRGVPAHRVARIGERTVTNLHLDSRRADPADLLDAPEIRLAEDTVRRAAAVFGGSGVIGFDLVVHGPRAHVLEANAFGDLLPGLRWGGRDPWDAALEAA